MKRKKVVFKNDDEKEKSGTIHDKVYVATIVGGRVNRCTAYIIVDVDGFIHTVRPYELIRIQDNTNEITSA